MKQDEVVDNRLWLNDSDFNALLVLWVLSDCFLIVLWFRKIDCSRQVWTKRTNNWNTISISWAPIKAKNSREEKFFDYHPFWLRQELKVSQCLSVCLLQSALEQSVNFNLSRSEINQWATIALRERSENSQRALREHSRNYTESNQSI